MTLMGNAADGGITFLLLGFQRFTDSFFYFSHQFLLYCQGDSPYPNMPGLIRSLRQHLKRERLRDVKAMRI